MSELHEIDREFDNQQNALKRIATLEALVFILVEALEDVVAVPNKHRPERVWTNAREAIRKARSE
jgi:hypothetical protein